MSTKKAGDVIELQKQDVKVVSCDSCGALMVNVKARDIEKGDFLTLKRLGLTLTNPNTKDQICLNCEIKREEVERQEKRKANTYFTTPSTHHHDDDDDSHSSFGGGFSLGGFGGFGGGSFSGGGATGSW